MDFRKNSVKIITELSRIIVGATFLFSGFVKAVDPLGSAYKIQDYLISFHLTDFLALALPLSIVAAVSEFLIGAFLLLGIYRKIATISVAVFMAFFLPLTLWIALKNPVKDCGCFGDALIISNWDTFYKNILLSVCAVVLLLNYRKITTLFSSKTAWMAAAFSVIFGFSFAIYNVVQLPIFDFRPYKIDANIPEQMHLDSSESDVVENLFVYSKDGVEQEFTEDNYPWNDSTWTFVKMKTNVIKEGKKPKIEDFYIALFDYDSLSRSFVVGEDITEKILSDTRYNFLMLSPSLREMNEKHLDKFKNIAEFAQKNGFGFYLVTSSSPDFIESWKEDNNFDSHFAFGDERVLKTMIRSNPGLILLKNGTVVNKWSGSQIPDFDTRYITPDLSKVEGLKTNFWGKLLVILLIFTVPLSLIKLSEIRRLR